MNKKILLIASLLLFITQPVISDTATIPYYLYNASTKFKVDVALLYALCKVESNCKTAAINHDDGTTVQKSLNIKSKSFGLFQIKLATARSLGLKGSGKDLLKPEVNTYYAAKLLRHLYNRYGDTYKVISAYNAGKYTKSNISYIHKVMKNYVRFKIDQRF